MKKFDIFYADLGSGIGSEQGGKRPVIIVSNNVCNEVSLIVTVIPLTTKAKKKMPTHVEITLWGKQSTILAEQVRTISRDRLQSNKIYTIRNKNIQKEINRALIIAMDLGEF